VTYLTDALRRNPELAVFLTLALGFLIGHLRIGSFRLGNVVGTLLAGVVIGQLDIHVDPIVKIVFFDLFLFATGYGPELLPSLLRRRPILRKPISLDQLKVMIDSLFPDAVAKTPH